MSYFLYLASRGNTHSSLTVFALGGSMQDKDSANQYNEYPVLP